MVRKPYLIVHENLRNDMSSFSPCLLVLLLLGFAFAPARVAAQPTPEMRRTVSVSGEGLIKVVPDMATIRFGVVTVDPNPETARRLNAEASADAMNVVRSLGVPERKIRLETLMLQPEREYNPETRQWIDRGYQATREVVVELEDLDRLPSLIAGVVQKGANRLNGIEYQLKNRSVARNDALREAVTSAREKAQLLTSALGAGLGRVMQIQEQSFDFPRPVFRAMMDSAMMSKAEAAPEPEAYAAGEMEVRANVMVVFELE